MQGRWRNISDTWELNVHRHIAGIFIVTIGYVLNSKWTPLSIIVRGKAFYWTLSLAEIDSMRWVVDEWNMNWDIGGMIQTVENWNAQWVTCPTLSMTYPTFTGPEVYLANDCWVWLWCLVHEVHKMNWLY